MTATSGLIILLKRRLQRGMVSKRKERERKDEEEKFEQGNGALAGIEE